MEYLKKHQLENNRVSRLKWMLEHTLGSPNAFEYRRQELSEMQQQPLKNTISVSDEDVLKSFIDSVNPKEDGEHFVLDYLRCGQIGVRINDVLYVHGGVNPQSINFVPDAKRFRYFERSTGDVVYKSVDDIPGKYLRKSTKGSSMRELDLWMTKLNEFKDDCLLDFETNPFWHEVKESSDGESSYFRRGGEALMGYQSTPATCGVGVIVPTFYEKQNDETSKPHAFPKAYLDYFKNNAVRYIVVGHKPVGSTPLVINASSANKLLEETTTSVNQMTPKLSMVPELRVIMADTSFSDPSRQHEFGHTRGKAVSEVLFSKHVSNSMTQVQLSGVLPNESAYKFKLKLSSDVKMNRKSNEKMTDIVYDGFGAVGRVTDDGYWIKVKLNETEYLGARTIGYKIEYEIFQNISVASLL